MFDSQTIYLFFTGALAAARYRETRQRKYRIRAQKALKQMKGFVEKESKGLNNVHRLPSNGGQLLVDIPW
jgi:hypothetical protein